MNTGNEQELRLRDLVTIISRYKYVIFTIALLSFIIAYIYAYYKPNIYQASSTVLIEKEDKQTLKPDDVVESALNITTTSNLNTEIEIIKSRFLVQKVIESLNLNKEYIATNTIGKKFYYYKDFPFDIDINSTENILLKITPKNKDKFLLEVKGENKLYIKKEYSYNSNIKEEGLNIIVNKKPNSTLDMSEYQVIYYKPSYLAQIISSEKLNVEILGEDTSILKISYTDTIPSRAQDFVNYLTKIYMEQNLKNKTKEVVFTLDFINKQLDKIKKSMNLSSKKLESFKIKSNTINIKESIRELTNQLSDYENQKNILSFKIDALKKIVQKIKKGTSLDSITLAGIDIDNTAITDLISQLQNALIQHRFLLKDYTYTHPKVQKVESQIIQLKNMIKKSVINLLNNLEYQQKVLDQKLLGLNNKLKKLSKNEQNFVALERNFLLNSKFYSYLLQKKTEAEIKKAATINRNRVLDYAVLPDKHIKPKRKIIYIIGLSFGLLIGLISIFIIYILGSTIKTVEDIETNLNDNVDIIGLISGKKFNKNNIEEFRNLRTNLNSLISKNKSNIITIVSTTHQEGKSFITSNLAKSLAKLEEKVLVIDANLRSPNIHNIFSIKNENGLSEYLIDNNIESRKYIQKKDNIHILPAGKSSEKSIELLSSNIFLNKIEELKNYYDIIIIDTATLSEASETKNIMSISDLVLYILKLNHSQKESLEIINKLSLKYKLAVVINNISNIKNRYKI